MREVVETLVAKGIPAKTVYPGLAAHTPGLTVDAVPFLTGTAAIAPTPATVPFYSSVTGGEFETTGLDGTYWLRNLGSEIRFEAAVRALWTAGHRVFLEIGAHPVLLGGVQETLEDAGAGTRAAASGVVASQRRGQNGVREWLTAMAQLYVGGVPVDWTAFFRGRDGRRIPLPTYPFGVEETDADQGAHTNQGAAAGGAPARGAGLGGLSLAGLTASERSYAVEEFVRAQVAAVLRHDDPDSVASDQGFLQSGFSSLQAVDLRNRLNEATGLRLPATLTFDHPTPAAVADLIGGLLTGRTEPGPARGTDQGPESAVLARLDALEAELLAAELPHDGHDAPGSTPTRERVAARLRHLLDRLAPDDEDEFGEASLEELLDLADNELRES